MTKYSANKGRLAKNTLMLYFRMGITMVISLYTSRIVLLNLGVDNYGIYGVVGALISTFSVFSSNLNSASQRFLSFELGKINGRFKNVFSSILGIHITASIVLFILIEIIGSYYIFHFLKVPDGRLNAAYWAFHFSTISFCLNIATIPYDSAIIAHEKLDFYAFIGVFEAIIKLVVVYLLIVSSFDKLISYAFLFLMSGIFIKSINITYCMLKVRDCRTFISYDKSIVLRIGKFFGWNGFGTLSYVLREQGISLLFNYFFGTTVNAAKSVTNQINNAVSSFSSNFIVALNPQITKSCAAQNYEEMTQLMYMGSKISYFLMLFLSLPIILNAEYVLHLWLVNPPEHSTDFIRLALIFFTLKALQSPLSIAIIATGNVKKYNLYWGGLNFIVFPLSLFLFYIGFGPNSSYYISIFFSLFVLFAMLSIYKEYFRIKYREYFRHVFSKTLLVTIIAVLLNILIMYVHVSNSLINFIINFFVCLVSTGFFIFRFGLSVSERKKIIVLIKNKILK